MMTNFKIDRIRQLQKEGLSVELIAKKVGVSIQTAYKFIDRSFLSVPGEVPRYNVKNNSEKTIKFSFGSDSSHDKETIIRELLMEGLSAKLIAEKAGVSRGTVSKYRHLFIGPRYSSRAIPLQQDKVDLIRKLQKEGFSFKYISRQVGVSLTTVYKNSDSTIAQLYSPQDMPLQQDKVDLIKKLQKEGLTVTLIAKDVGVSIKSVKKYIDQSIGSSVSSRSSRNSILSQDKIDRIRKLRAEGLTLELIAKAVAVSASTVLKYSVLISVPRPPSPHRLQQDKIDRIQQLRTEGLSVKLIAKEVGVSTVTVCRYLNQSIYSSQSIVPFVFPEDTHNDH